MRERAFASQTIKKFPKKRRVQRIVGPPKKGWRSGGKRKVAQFTLEEKNDFLTLQKGLLHEETGIFSQKANEKRGEAPL